MPSRVGHVTPVFTVCAPEDFSVHLMRFADDVRVTLCGRQVNSARPSLRFLVAGCLTCAQQAVACGVLVAPDGVQTFVSLQRFIDRRSRGCGSLAPMRDS